MIILGQFFGNNAIAAVGATASLVYMIIHVIGGITTGLSVHTSSCDGNADWPGLARYHMANIWICLVGAVGLFILFWFSTDLLLKALQVPTAIYTDAKIYIRIIFAGIPVTVFNNLWGATLRGLKDSKTPALSLVISILLNFVLDWILIAVFRCGVLGAALATVLSQTLSAIICYIGLQRLLTRKAILCNKVCGLPIEEIKKNNSVDDVQKIYSFTKAEAYGTEEQCCVWPTVFCDFSWYHCRANCGESIRRTNDCGIYSG